MTHLREKMERERKVLSLELRSLRQQLNPHFISNAMNAIKEYIQRPNTEDSARYLTDFSLMMRSFLESSRRRFTPIADEVDMMKRYVSLEQLRYPGKFDVVFTIDPDLDPAMDEVPSLLLQPIIENAIEHGLRPLNSGGYLRICFELDPDDDDVIICTVSDNGVGRKIAAMRSKSPGHISRATAILEERQALLASDDEIKLSVLVTDLYPEREHTGTVVTVRIEAG
jgi:LytS/YehU family sensor histidine kinase